MLATGIRTPVGIKIFGPNLDEIERIGLEMEKTFGRARHAERLCRAGHYGLFPRFRRSTATRSARYGLTVEDVQEVIESAIGGMNLTTTVEGRERYPVNIRYGRELRNDIEKLKRVLVPIDGRGPGPAGPARGHPGDARPGHGPERGREAHRRGDA